MALAGSGMYQVASAQNQQTTSQAPLTPEQMEKLREDAKSLAGLLGIEVANQNQTSNQAPNNSTPSNQSQQAASPPAQNPTLAKVADKALEMASGLLASIATTLQKAAPEAWRIMIRQQYAKAGGLLLVPWGLFVGALIFLLIARKTWLGTCKTKDCSCSDCKMRFAFKSVIPVCFMVLFGVWGFVRLSDSIMYLINPEFYAIRDLVLLVLNRGQGVN